MKAEPLNNLRRIAPKFAPFPIGIEREFEDILNAPHNPGPNTSDRDISQEYLDRMSSFFRRVRDKMDNNISSVVFLVNDLDPENPGRFVEHGKEWIDRTGCTTFFDFNSYFTKIRVYGTR